MFLCVRSNKYWHADNEHERGICSCSVCLLYISVISRLTSGHTHTHGQTVKHMCKPHSWNLSGAFEWHEKPTLSSQTGGQTGGRTGRKGSWRAESRGNWGEVANLVIMSAAANSTSSGKVETQPPWGDRSYANSMVPWCPRKRTGQEVE